MDSVGEKTVGRKITEGMTGKDDFKQKTVTIYSVRQSDGEKKLWRSRLGQLYQGISGFEDNILDHKYMRSKYFGNFIEFIMMILILYNII